MITSIRNNKVKAWRKLHKRKERIHSGTFLIEGLHLVEEAWKSDWIIEEIIVIDALELPYWSGELPVEFVSDPVFQYISQTKTPQGIAAVVKMSCPVKPAGNHLLLIDAVQDPGNLGTMVRTADASGFDGIVLGNDTVDLYNDKVIRATQGSLFHVPIFQANLKDEIMELKQHGFHVWATALSDNAKPYYEMATNDKLALMVGNEGSGLQTELLQLADTIVTIPIYGKAESLNVSVAAGILMYHVKLVADSNETNYNI
ncbi:RNA methyltransferase [Virgibacillus sp. NKC19-3]|uniref:TrmH family RNA methyltransferase n=1 Tax=Virgibacillus saliphilus TaxID=2831674 RepID=UPI001C9ABC88|nr:RNA methyltransferase [Virgibacillus sp. NKC19-3]MBY7143207.1 RNA methyltransferase [Virgibacillus sp. NKC19-3]